MERGGAVVDGTMTTIRTVVIVGQQQQQVGKQGESICFALSLYPMSPPHCQRRLGPVCPGGGGIGGSGNDKGEASKGVTTRENKGMASEGTIGNGNAKGKARLEASKGTVGNGNNKGKAIECAVGNGHKQSCHGQW